MDYVVFDKYPGISKQILPDRKLSRVLMIPKVLGPLRLSVSEDIPKA